MNIACISLNLFTSTVAGKCPKGSVHPTSSSVTRLLMAVPQCVLDFRKVSMLLCCSNET